MPVAKYWNLNQIYIIITAFVIIGFLIAYSVLYVRFQIDISKDLNTHCENPIAMYFDKTSRERCLTEKITKKNELGGLTKDFETKVKTSNAVLNEIKKKIKETDA
jgi:methyl-accepting chemotaxis protein